VDDLIGRDVELARLHDRLRDAASGRGRLVLVGGDPGIGKTRLAEEVARRAAAMAMPVAWGRGVETEGAPPFWPWRQVVRDLAAQRDPQETRAAAGGRGEAVDLGDQRCGHAGGPPVAPAVAGAVSITSHPTVEGLPCPAICGIAHPHGARHPHSSSSSRPRRRVALTHLVDTSVLTRLGAPAVRSILEPLTPQAVSRAGVSDLEVGYSARTAPEWARCMRQRASSA
jgi:hypothetical protein